MTDQVQSIQVGSTIKNGPLKFTGAVVSINEQTVDFGVSNKTVIIDNTQDIQTNIDSINTAGGGVLYLKSGVYSVTSPLTIYSNIQIYGDAETNTIIDFGSTSSNLTLTGTSTYSTGTISSISGGVNVVGSGTTWTAAMTGQQIFINNRWYIIVNVSDTTHLTLASGYADGTTFSGSYRISSVIHDVRFSRLTIKNSSTTGLVATDIRDIFFEDMLFLTNNKGFALTNFMQITCNRVNVVSSTSNGYELTNGSFFNAAVGLAAVSNGGSGAVLNTVKACGWTLSASDANTADGYNCTSVTNCYFNTEVAGNGGKGIQFVTGCNNNFISIAIISGNVSDGIKLTASSSFNTIGTGATITGNGGWGINIAASSCSTNTIIAPIYSANTAGNLTDSGTGTIVIAASTTVTDATISTSDVTTNNATSLKHGWLAKLSGSANDVLRGDGTFGAAPAPSGIGLSLKAYQTAAAASSITINSLDLATDLEYFYVVKVDSLSGGDSLYAQINGDTNTHYTYVHHATYWNGAAAGTADTGATTVAQFALETTQNAKRLSATGEMVLSTDGTNARVAFTWESLSYEPATPLVNSVTGAGANNTATTVTSVKFFTASGSTGNWKVWIYKRAIT